MESRGGPAQGKPGVTGAIDCPDGLARCEAGEVTASRLATLPQPCLAPPPACSCPWEIVAECPAGCVAEGVELVVERARASTQLCAPAGDAAPPADLAAAGAVSPVGCEEGEVYRCGRGLVVDCRSRALLGRCMGGCYAEGASVDDDGVVREDAFALLCSR